MWDYMQVEVMKLDYGNIQYRVSVEVAPPHAATGVHKCYMYFIVGLYATGGKADNKHLKYEGSCILKCMYC